MNQTVELLIGLGILLALQLIFHLGIKSLIKKALERLSRDRNFWLFAFFRDERFVFWFLSVPYFTLLSQGLAYVPHVPEQILIFIHKMIGVAYIFLGIMIMTQTSRVVNEVYSRSELSKKRPIKGYLQGLLIVLYLLGSISMIAVLIDRSPWMLFSGLGAMTAVLLLVFKDSLLSLVAGVQLTANDLIRVGDWIEMPQFNTDGDVIEIALHNVKVQNWDRTITVIPAHKFLEHSFKNWRGMQESGGRRIKRSIHIDLNSIRFLTEADVQSFSHIKLIEGYLKGKVEEIAHFNKKLDQASTHIGANLRRLTNIGTFRAYVSQYLRNHPGINQELIFLIRHLDPGPEGLPLEIYVFTNDTRWTYYEGIQADIFDHLLAVMPEFGLRVFQRPSGRDFMHFLPDSLDVRSENT
jgi:miniconductance mechanosensitive channel